MEPIGELVVSALEISQGNDRKIYSFAVDGKILPKFTTISRIHRVNGNEIAGYQRPEVLAHILDIRGYLESENPMLPTNIVIAFDDSVVFEPLTDYSDSSETGCPGNLRIPIHDSVSESNKAGWIVDGQQRVAAIRDADIEKFPVFVTGFLAASDKEQREQFILVNSPKPLSKDLIYELLPGTESKLPALLQRRRFSAGLLQRLNHDEDSPLKEMVRTPTNPKGVIKDNSILKMIEHSLSDGVLFRYRTPGTSEGDTEAMLVVLKAFWAAAAEVFEDAWGLIPKQSRLMHGAGIISLGLLMDAISENYPRKKGPTFKKFLAELYPLQNVCHWTKGSWDFLDGRQRKWNEIQNTPKDVQMLAMHLLLAYRQKTSAT